MVVMPVQATATAAGYSEAARHPASGRYPFRLVSCRRHHLAGESAASDAVRVDRGGIDPGLEHRLGLSRPHGFRRRGAAHLRCVDTVRAGESGNTQPPS